VEQEEPVARSRRVLVVESLDARASGLVDCFAVRGQ